MRLTPESGILQLRGHAQWQRCALHDTALVDDVVMLRALPPEIGPEVVGNFDGGFAGLAFDPHCRLFHPLPEAGRVEVVLWGRTSTLGVHATTPDPFDITAAGTETGGAPTGPLPQRPLALACDDKSFLYIADPDAKAVWLVDTWQQEVSRRIEFEHAPLDLAACGAEIYVLLADGSTWQLAPCDEPLRTRWPAVAGAVRLSVSPSARGDKLAWVLLRAGRVDAVLHSLHLGLPIATPFATDLVSEAEHPEFGAMLTLAQRPGEEFLRMRLLGNQPSPQPALMAPHYDGRGIAQAPDGRIVFWTAQGLRHAAPARTRYQPDGRVFAFALDSGQDQSPWGRLVVEACIPPGTQLVFRAFSRDELDFADPIDGLGPGGPEPLLPQHVWDHADGPPQQLYRDTSQRPLAPAPAEGFALYDAPVIVPPGRYLWLVFELRGSRGKSPRLRSAQVEYPGHGLLRKLPRTLWREPAARDFLFRYLMPLAAMLDEWGAVSDQRHRLLDARIAPDAALPWLAGFVGLVLDPCWPAAVQRRMVLEAAALFRTRGTVASLHRMLELLTGAEVVLIEQFRLRGGGVVGNGEANTQGNAGPSQVSLPPSGGGLGAARSWGHAQAVLGVGYRVGGMIGTAQPVPLEGAEAAAEADFDELAHRFNVTIVAALDDAQLACVRRLIEHHKPAHTDFTLCTAQAGIRAGLGAHVGISSVIGKSSGFKQALVGDTVLGTGYLLGRPELQTSEPEGFA